MVGNGEEVTADGREEEMVVDGGEGRATDGREEVMADRRGSDDG